MKTLLLVMGLMGLMSWTASAIAEEKAQTLGGTISKIDDAKVTVVRTPGLAKGRSVEVIVTTTEKTVVKPNGGPDQMTMKDLAVGQKVWITLDAEGNAATIMVEKYTPGPPGG